MKNFYQMLNYSYYLYLQLILNLEPSFIDQIDFGRVGLSKFSDKTKCYMLYVHNEKAKN